MPSLDCHQGWRMALDPRRASIIDIARIATGTCVALIGYFSYVLISILAAALKAGISDSNLPPGSTVYFREPTVWERYSWQIALITAVILLQAGLISALLREHRRRKFSEVQSRQRMAELAHVNRFSTAGELTASIAHEINQPLGSI